MTKKISKGKNYLIRLDSFTHKELKIIHQNASSLNTVKKYATKQSKKIEEDVKRICIYEPTTGKMKTEKIFYKPFAGSFSHELSWIDY